MQELLKQVPDATSRFKLEGYLAGSMGRAPDTVVIEEAAALGRENGVPADLQRVRGVSRLLRCCLADGLDSRCEEALEADGIGWAMWDYRGGFGVVYKQDGQPARVEWGGGKRAGAEEQRLATPRRRPIAYPNELKIARLGTPNAGNPDRTRD